MTRTSDYPAHLCPILDKAEAHHQLALEHLMYWRWAKKQNHWYGAHIERQRMQAHRRMAKCYRLLAWLHYRESAA